MTEFSAVDLSEEKGMQWQAVDSSQIEAIGYESGAEYPLGIKFPANKKQKATGEPGSRYDYKNVTPEMYGELLAAKDNPVYNNSIGSFFGKNIKAWPELYPFVKVEADPSLSGTPVFTPTQTSTDTTTGSTPTIESPGSTLALIDTMVDDLLFTPGKITDAQLAIMRSDWLTEAKKYDISTEKARTELKRFARPLQKLRTGIEARAKELTGSTKRKIAAIDSEKRRLVQIVGGIEQEVLQRLNDYEAAEEARIETRNAAIKEIQEAGTYTQANWMGISVEAMRDRLHEIESDTREWPELGELVPRYRSEAIGLIKGAIQAREEYEKGQAELARWRAEAAERAEQDRLAAIERAAKERAERDAAESVAAAERERLASEQRAEAAEAKAKADQIEAEQKAQEALKRADIERIAAVAKERLRIEDEQREERIAAEARAADEVNRAKVNGEAIFALQEASMIGEESASQIVHAIAEGLIPHVTIQY